MGGYLSVVCNARCFCDDARLDWKAVISMVTSECAGDDRGMFCTTPVIVAIHVSVEKVVVCLFLGILVIISGHFDEWL